MGRNPILPFVFIGDATLLHLPPHPGTQLLQVLYGAGLRVSEVVALRIADVDSSRGVFAVRQAKGFKDRYVPLSPTLLALLREYWRIYTPSEFLFENSIIGGPLSVRTAQAIFQKAKALSGIRKKVSAHTLRHSYATHLLDKGAEINAVKDLLGHSSLAATQVYTHNSMEKLKKVFEQAHPKA